MSSLVVIPSAQILPDTPHMSFRPPLGLLLDIMPFWNRTKQNKEKTRKKTKGHAPSESSINKHLLMWFFFHGNYLQNVQSAGFWICVDRLKASSNWLLCEPMLSYQPSRWTEAPSASKKEAMCRAELYTSDKERIAVLSGIWSTNNNNSRLAFCSVLLIVHISLGLFSKNKSTPLIVL